MDNVINLEGSKQKVCFRTLEILDQRVPIAFDYELEDAIKDILNRPHLADKRKVKLEVELSPKQIEGGDVDIFIVVRVSPASRPARETEAHRVALTRNQPIAYFNADVPNRPRQPALFDKEQSPTAPPAND